MAYKKGEDRRQKVFFPDCIDEYVEVMLRCVCLMHLSIA